jgi:hypothetical protein
MEFFLQVPILSVEMRAITPTQKFEQSYVNGIGATGALLAAAAIGFISLLGLVSSQVWPESGGINSIVGQVPLDGATSESSPATRSSTPSQSPAQPAPEVTVAPKPATAPGTGGKAHRTPHKGRVETDRAGNMGGITGNGGSGSTPTGTDEAAAPRTSGNSGNTHTSETSGPKKSATATQGESSSPGNSGHADRGSNGSNGHGSSGKHGSKQKTGGSASHGNGHSNGNGHSK